MAHEDSNSTRTVNKDGNNKDTSCENEKKYVYKMEIVWKRVIIMLALHLMAVYGWVLHFQGKFATFVFYKIIGSLSSLGITGGAHRLWSHKAYKANYICQTILMIMATTTYQNSIFTWCRDHRLHHKYSETDADPHNSTRGFFFSHIGWLLVKKHKEVIEKGKEIDMSDLQANPIVMFQHRHYYKLVFFFGFFLTCFIPMYFWDESFKVAFFAATVYRYTIQMHVTWCINSLAHLSGKKTYNKRIGPRENLLMKYVSFGEGFHNYHHTFPWDYKAAELSNDTRNVTTYMIDFFAWLGWVTDRKTVPENVYRDQIAQFGDGTHKSRPSGTWLFNIKKSSVVKARDAFCVFFFIFVIV